MSGRAAEEMMINGTFYLEDDSTLWLPTKYPGYYVCREGFVAHNGQLVKMHKGDRQGHWNVRISLGNGKVKEEYVHRLILETFKGNPQNYPVARHLDDDRDNNRLENLVWGTQKDNHDDAVRNRTYRPFTDEDREKHLAEQRTPIVAIRIETGEKLFFLSQTEASKVLGIQQANIWKVLHGQRSHAGGFNFYFNGGEYHGRDN